MADFASLSPTEPTVYDGGRIAIPEYHLRLSAHSDHRSGRRRSCVSPPGSGNVPSPPHLKDMKSAGCNKVQLLSHKRHSCDGAHQLYTSLGFEPEAERFRLYLSSVPKEVEEARLQ